jgi:hypothetical protein
MGVKPRDPKKTEPQSDPKKTEATVHLSSEQLRAIAGGASVTPTPPSTSGSGSGSANTKKNLP